MKYHYMFIVAALLLSTTLFAAVVKSPLDVSGMTSSEAQKHLTTLAGKPIKVEGVVKDINDLKTASLPLNFEIPTYQHDGSKYVRYGVVCQYRGESTIIFADEGYLSSFVKKNVVDRPVLATGKIVDGRRVSGLPSEMVFVIDSLNLEE